MLIECKIVTCTHETKYGVGTYTEIVQKGESVEDIVNRICQNCDYDPNEETESMDIQIVKKTLELSKLNFSGGSIISTENLEKLKLAYKENKEKLKEIEKFIQEHGSLDNGVSDIKESFEMGYNNALEFVLNLLG